jgi:hypothetical protein
MHSNSLLESKPRKSDETFKFCMMIAAAELSLVKASAGIEQARRRERKRD